MITSVSNDPAGARGCRRFRRRLRGKNWRHRHVRWSRDALDMVNIEAHVFSISPSRDR